MQMQMALKTNYVKSLGAADSLEPRASQLFEKAFRPANLSGLSRFFGKETKPLLSLEETAAGQRIVNQYDGGSQTVEVARIQGTLNKQTDFDRDFHPTQRHSENRWLRVATAFLRGVELPPIELVRVGENFFVKDGHHRVSAARAMGFSYLDAKVTIWEMRPENE